MSVFGSLMGDVRDDPFYNTHARAMQQMNRMMDSMFSDPFQNFMPSFGFPSLMGPGIGISNNMGCHPHRARTGDIMDHWFPNMNQMFQGMEAISGNPSCHSYSSSSVVTMTSGPDGQPKVYKASSSTHTAPGGVTETRKTVQDPETGIQKMSIGHHLQEKSHVFEREKNHYTGEEEETQSFINLDEEEADEFNREWQARTQQMNAIQYGGHTGLNAGRRHGHGHVHRSNPINQPLALTAAPSQAHEHSRKRVHDRRSGRHGNFKHSRPHYETNM